MAPETTSHRDPIEEAREVMEGLGMVVDGMDDLVQQVVLASGTSDNILLLGETGTGKGVTARAIDTLMRLHEERSGQSMVERNCAAIPKELVESDLFGHVTGAFTGAASNREGIIQHANGGRLFLDEIGDLEKPMQAKLLRAIEDGHLYPVGSDTAKTVDVQYLAATSPDKALSDGSAALRQDLYYRLAGEVIRIPPFRVRPAEAKTPVLQAAFKFAPKSSNRVPNSMNVQVEDEVIDVLSAQSFPGNVRQVQQVAHQIYRLAELDALDANRELREVIVRRSHVTAQILTESNGSQVQQSDSGRVFGSEVQIHDANRSLAELEQDLLIELLIHIDPTLESTHSISEQIGISDHTLVKRATAICQRIGFSTTKRKNLVVELAAYLREIHRQT